MLMNKKVRNKFLRTFFTTKKAWDAGPLMIENMEIFSTISSNYPESPKKILKLPTNDLQKIQNIKERIHKGINKKNFNKNLKK